MKRHTGGGFMTARLMRENTFQFEITHKLWLMTNHRPGLDRLDEAMRGRLHIVPFDRTWNRPGHPAPDPRLPDGDRHLMEQLSREHEGILAWLVEGAVAYHCCGLIAPPEVNDLTGDYFNEIDAMGRWLDERDQCEPQDGAMSTDLFNDFKSWAVAAGGPDSRSHVAFSKGLRDRGVRSHKTAKGTQWGVRLLNAGW